MFRLVFFLLSWMQGDFTNYCCFLWLGDSRVWWKPYVQKDWSTRHNSTIGVQNIEPVTSLRLVKNLIRLVNKFFKALDKNNISTLYYGKQFWSRPWSTDPKTSRQQSIWDIIIIHEKSACSSIIFLDFKYNSKYFITIFYSIFRLNHVPNT